MRDPVLETERLRLRHLTVADAAFTLELMNDPDFLRNIGDKGVRTLADAERYLETGAIASYAAHGFGLYMVEERTTGDGVGICGLVRRDGLDDVDVGFAFLPVFRARGYATESAAAVLRHGRDDHGLERIVAITSPANHGSIAVLRKIGLRFERMVRLPGAREEIELHGPG